MATEVLTLAGLHRIAACMIVLYHFELVRVGAGIIYRLGTLSYAMYLLQEVVLWGAERVLTNSYLVDDAIAVTALLGLTTLAHIFLELPGRRLIRGSGVPAREPAVARGCRSWLWLMLR